MLWIHYFSSYIEYTIAGRIAEIHIEIPQPLQISEAVIICNTGSILHNKIFLHTLHLKTAINYLIAYNRSGQPVRDKSHIHYCVVATSHIIHMDTHEHHPISSSLAHIPLLS